MTVQYEITREEYMEVCAAQGQRKNPGGGRGVRFIGYAVICVGFFVVMNARGLRQAWGIAVIIAGLWVLIGPVWRGYFRGGEFWEGMLQAQQPMAVGWDWSGARTTGVLWATGLVRGWRYCARVQTIP